MVQFTADALLGHAEPPAFWRQPALPVAPRPTVAAPGRFVSYSARKPYVVAERLEDLRGPTAGTVTLPAHLDWSGNATYDLGKPARLVSMYRSVLNEAGCADDLRAWLDGRVLARLWPTLWLPPALRRVWEDRFPHLRALRA